MRAALLALLILVPDAAHATEPPRLTPDGWGALRIGMAEREAVRRFGLRDGDPQGEVTGPECRQYQAPAWPQLEVMTEDGRVTRISLYRKGPIRTDRGLGVGSTEAQVRKAYGAALRIEPHYYEGAPARYLTWRAAGGKRGLRFETDAHRRVTTIHAGAESITYVEGCL